MNLTGTEKIYFIGIGGIAMSAVAGIAKELGHEVLGSDSKELYDPAKSVLDKYGIQYFTGYNVENIKNSGADFYIASAGEDLNNPEVMWLEEQGIRLYSFSELLRNLMNDKLRIVVAGTHGKSTTSGMLGVALHYIDQSSFMTGAVLQKEESNFFVGDGHYFVVEGDEYKALHDDPTPKFAQYDPDICLLNNLEFDHPDMFASLDELVSEVNQMIEKMPDDGLVVYNSDSSELNKIMHGHNIGQVSFGIKNEADFVAKNIQTLESHTSFDVEKKVNGQPATEAYKINLFGGINVYNALGVISLLRTLGFSHEQVQDGLDEYYGVKRRMELVGTRDSILIFDDYAHHPTAIRETLSALKERFPTRKLWAVFEPHTFSRTQSVLPDLAKAFNNADEVLLAEIYPAREKRPEHTITGSQVLEEIIKNQPNARLVADKDQALHILRQELYDNDVVVVMAVGNFNRLAYNLIN